jgi:SAM-dependent methyltransferase
MCDVGSNSNKRKAFSLKGLIKSSILVPTRLKILKRNISTSQFALLDIGCGSHSASLTKKYFPSCDYYGVDRTREYFNDPRDFSLMRQFYQIDVSTLNFDALPDSFFDVVIMSHIIEHLQNGPEVIRALMSKVKPGGLIYVEYPSKRTTRFPSMRGTLNFYDDPTHCRQYDLGELSALFLTLGCTVVEAGIRRDWVSCLDPSCCYEIKAAVWIR